MNIQERQWIKATLEGDQKAKALLIERYYDRVLQLAMRTLRSREDAQDVSQEVFLKVFVRGKLSLYRGNSEFWTWLYRVTVNQCKSHFSRAGCRQSMAAADPERVAHLLVDPRPDVETQMIRREERKRMRRSIQQLNAKYRALIIGRYYLRRSYAELSKRMRLSAVNLRVGLLRGKHALGRAWEAAA